MGFFHGQDGFFQPLADPLCGDAEKWFGLNPVGLPKGAHSPKKSGLRFSLGQYLSFQGGDF